MPTPVGSLTEEQHKEAARLFQEIFDNMRLIREMVGRVGFSDKSFRSVNAMYRNMVQPLDDSWIERDHQVASDSPYYNVMPLGRQSRK